MRCARACLYRPEGGNNRGTRGIAITSYAEVGDGRAPHEASPLRGRRLWLCITELKPKTEPIKPNRNQNIVFFSYRLGYS
jgi:hypothetical protein